VSVITSGSQHGPRRRARAGRELLVLFVFSAVGCTLTADEFEPNPVSAQTETDGLAGTGAPSVSDPAPAGSPMAPATVLDPGEAEPPIDRVPTEVGDQNAGGTRSGAEERAPVRDAGPEPSDAGDAGDAADAGTSDAGTSANDSAASASTLSSTPEASTPAIEADASTMPTEMPSQMPTEPVVGSMPSQPCPGLVFQGSCYGFFSDQLSWNAAEERCVAWGGHLASVESSDEDAFLSAWPVLVGSGFGDGSGLWLGGTDAQHDGDFRWLGDRELGFLGWAPDQPNDGQGIDCIEKRNDATQRWYDRRCTDGERFVCERPQ
jgi:hypothetical protein